MDINEAMSIFKKEVGKKVIAYENRPNSCIIITEYKDGPCDTTYYEVDDIGDVKVTNPILCDLNFNKVINIK